jgi:hypothetical protein
VIPRLNNQCMNVQGWEQEVTGQCSMALAEYYEMVFSSFGFSRPEIQAAVEQVGTEDYQTIVEFLHARSSTPCSHSTPGSHLMPLPSPMASSMQTTPLTTPISSAAASNASSKCMYTATQQ